MRNGVTSQERDRIKALEREVRELRQAIEILRKAPAFMRWAHRNYIKPASCWQPIADHGPKHVSKGSIYRVE